MEVQLLLYVLLIHSRIKHMTATMTRLVGQELLDYIASNESSMTKTEQCLGAGYVRQGPGSLSGETMAAFTDFYEAIIKAKGIDPMRNAFEDGSWYDNLSAQDKDLNDMIESICPEFTKLSGTKCQEFMDELSEYGITTASQFEDAYFYTTDAFDPEADFAEVITTEINCVDIPDYVVVDWQATWDHYLSYDFFTIEFDGDTYFFHNNF